MAHKPVFSQAVRWLTDSDDLGSADHRRERLEALDRTARPKMFQSIRSGYFADPDGFGSRLESSMAFGAGL